MRLIDADALITAKTKKVYEPYDEVVRVHDIKNAPTVDAETVVRCKNCKFVDTLECPLNYIDHQRLIFSNRSPDWFCAEGVKKDET